MNRLALYICLLAAATAAAAQRLHQPQKSGGSCPGGVCPLPKAPMRENPAGDWFWVQDAKQPGYWYLYRGNQQHGTFHPGKGYYRLNPDGTWSEKPEEPPVPAPAVLQGMVRSADCGCGAVCPCEKPCPCAAATASEIAPTDVAAAAPIEDHGVDLDKIHQAPAYAVSGRACTRAQAFEAIEKSGLVDDSRKRFLTYVGDRAGCEVFLRDMAAPQFARVREQIHANCYAPDEWQTRQVGLAPGVSFQDPPDAAGRAPVLFRFPENPGATALLAAIRNVDPKYDPAKDPDPAKPLTPALPKSFSEVPAWVWILAAGVVLLTLKKKA